MQLPKNFISLQYMCSSKIAIDLYNDPDVQHFINNHEVHACIWSSEQIKAFLRAPYNERIPNAKVLEYRKEHRLGLSIKRSNYNEYLTHEGEIQSLPNEEWEILVSEKLASLRLPKLILKEVKTLLRLVVIESDKWFRNHRAIVECTGGDITQMHLNFCWTQDAKIDREKTAKVIIGNRTIDIKTRFRLACHYCFEEDVISLWRILDDYQEFFDPNFFDVFPFNVEQIWIHWAKDGSAINWETIARKSKKDLLGLRTYFPKLTKEKRLKLLLTDLKERWITYYELHFCLAHLDQDQQNEVLKQCPLQILDIYFDWPIQSELLNVLDLLWPYISVHDYRYFFDRILHQKIVFDSDDLNCIFLIKNIWEKSPPKYREFAKKDKLYNILKIVLDYDGKVPFQHSLFINSIGRHLKFHSAGTLFTLSKSMIPLWNLKRRNTRENASLRSRAF